MLWRLENLPAIIKSNQAASMILDPKKWCVVSDAASLHQIVGIDDDGISAAQTADQIFDHTRGDRIERAAWLIHQ